MNTYKLPENTLIERLRANYIDAREISASDQQIKERWEFAYSLILNEAESDKNVVKMLMKRFGISDQCAYNDVRDCKNLFGDIRKSNKDALRHMVTQWAIDLYRMSKQTKNFKGMEKALERITKVNNLDIDDPDLPDASKIQPPVQLLALQFNIINSPRFKLIDESAQSAILGMYDEFMSQLKLSPMAEYSDMFQIEPTARAEK